MWLSELDALAALGDDRVRAALGEQFAVELWRVPPPERRCERWRRRVGTRARPMSHLGDDSDLVGDRCARGAALGARAHAVVIADCEAERREMAEYVASLMPQATVRDLSRSRGWPSGRERAANVTARPRLEAIQRFIGIEPKRAHDGHDPLNGAVHRHRRTQPSNRHASETEAGRSWSSSTTRPYERRSRMARRRERHRRRRLLCHVRRPCPRGSLRGRDLQTACATLASRSVPESIPASAKLIDGKAGGIAVSIGARIASARRALQVLVSQTVKDLVAGSGFSVRAGRRARTQGRARPLAAL